jgi:hypothetical protein
MGVDDFRSGLPASFPDKPIGYKYQAPGDISPQLH